MVPGLILMHAMPGEYSPSVVRPGAVSSCEKLVPGRLPWNITLSVPFSL